MDAKLKKVKCFLLDMDGTVYLDGVPIDGAIEAMDEGAQEDGATTVLEKYMRGKTADRETLYKAFRYLLGKGFTYEVAKSALSRFGEIDEEGV